MKKVLTVLWRCKESIRRSRRSFRGSEKKASRLSWRLWERLKSPQRVLVAVGTSRNGLGGLGIGRKALTAVGTSREVFTAVGTSRKVFVAVGTSRTELDDRGDR